MKRKNNNGIFYVVISLVAVLGIASLVSAYAINQSVSVNEGGVYNNYEATQSAPEGDLNLGGVSPDKYQHQYFHTNYSVGGDGAYFATSSTESTFTLTTTQLDANREDSFISWNAGLDTTLTTMASSSAPLAGLDVGESYSLLVYSATTTAATTITYAAGTGVDLQEIEGLTVVQNGLELARLTFVKKVDTDVIMLVEVFQVGD